MISEELETIIQNDFQLSKNKKHEFLTLEHLLLELCKDDEILKFFRTKNIKVAIIIKNLKSYIENKLEI